MRILKSFLFALTFGGLLSGCGSDNDPSDAKKLTACFNEVPSVVAGIEIEFNSDCSENETSYLWDFGDESTSTEANPKYTFTKEGTYTVTLTVSNETESASTERIVTIQSIASTCSVTHSNRDVKVSETWKSGETHCINGFFQIMDGAVLTIEPGVTVKLARHAGIYVVGDGAGLIAEGTESEPILFTSREAVPQVGDWVSVKFTSSNSAESRLKYCTFEYGGSEVYSSFDDKEGLVGIVRDTNVSIDNCVFRKSLSHAIRLDSYAELKSFTNNTISEAGDYAIFAQTQNVHSIGEDNVINNKGIWIEGEWFEKDVTWLKQTCPYYTNGFSVGNDEGMTLTIEAGVEIRFREDYGSSVGVGEYGNIGKLVAQGTATEKIKFTSAAESPAPGDWSGFHFDVGTMSGTILDHVVIEYASGTNTEWGALEVNTNGLQMYNSTVKDIKGIAIHLNVERGRRFAGFSNNTISAPSTVHAIRMTTMGIPSIGEGNTITGKSIYALANGFPDVEQILWRNLNLPYIVDGNVMLGSATYPNYTFTIEAGTVLKLTTWSGFTIANSEATKFIAQGTAENPIIFTSAKDTPAPGDWDGIEFYNRLTAGSIMDHCIVEYGGERYANISSIGIAAGILTISNCEMNYSVAYGFYSYESNTTLTNNTYTGNVSGDMNFQ